ncbi:chemotaxis protein [Leisingera sp. ANG-M1]|uniref:CHASE3 domain-containing protein n=1 Tax=Leisingera sp. ANG-M1 TaxID=1577895 RepID=UPI00057DD8CF|nr:CHASE3 domain-containing protein [Leisingera sp. ANG-M1]KIC11675.1 chemotaxis protein [Leisingera sp. ANG-M1]
MSKAAPAGRNRFSISNIKTRPKVLLASLLPLVLVVGVGVLAVVNLGKMAERAKWVEHTQYVLSESEAILAAALNMETGLRGYLLAGQEEYFAPYQEGGTEAFAKLAALQETVSDNPVQVERLQEAQRILSGWQSDVAETAITLRLEIGDSQTMNDMADEVKKARGKVFFDEFRAKISQMIEEEEVLLADRRNTFAALVNAGIADPDYLNNSLQAVENTHQVISQAKDLLAAAVDMETGMRGFLLAGDKAFLEPYLAGSKRFNDILADLRLAMFDDMMQMNRLNAIGETIDEWRNTVVVPMLDLRREIGDAATMDDMADLVAEGRGKTYFDAFRAVMAEFQAEEEALMVTRREANEAISAQTRTLLPVAIGAAVLFGSVLALAIGSSMASAVQSITKAMKGLADGDNAVKITGQQRGDEVGDMARSLEVFRDQLAQMQEAEQKKAEGKDAELKNVVQELSSRLSRLSEGDLTIQIQENFPEEYEQLRADFNASIENLSTTVVQVVDSTSSIRNGAAEISQASDDLSQRTESQAATLEQTAAAIDELTASVRNAAEGARNVESTVQEARQEAEESGEVVQSAVTAMGGIEESSTKISQIISVIDDIAFQTNLLALNAGVEAARAGEAGRGFAVVASEVRALAQRSSDAAMEIKTLIGDSTRQVEQGVDLVGRAGEALQSIVGRVSHISQLVSEIAEGAAEQSTGLAEINTGMTQLDQVTQQNAAMVEEATAAGHMLNNDAGKLSELVSNFRISGDTAVRTAPPAPALPDAGPAPSAHGDGWAEEPAPVPAAAAEGNAARNLWQDF